MAAVILGRSTHGAPWTVCCDPRSAPDFRVLLEPSLASSRDDQHCGSRPCFIVFSPGGVSVISLRKAEYTDSYSRLLFSGVSDINEKAQYFYLFTGASSRGWWSLAINSVLFCFALESSFIFLSRQHLDFMTLGCTHFLACLLTGVYFISALKLF